MVVIGYLMPNPSIVYQEMSLNKFKGLLSIGKLPFMA